MNLTCFLVISYFFSYLTLPICKATYYSILSFPFENHKVALL